MCMETPLKLLKINMIPFPVLLIVPFHDKQAVRRVNLLGNNLHVASKKWTEFGKMYVLFSSTYIGKDEDVDEDRVQIHPGNPRGGK